jgi:hypothetical protein
MNIPTKSLPAGFPATATATISIESEYMSVRGNCMASGDDAVDKAQEDDIISRLEDGNDWAWCTVAVTVSDGDAEGVAYLGGCSYADAEDFMANSGYFSDMLDEALLEYTHDVARIVDKYAK